MGPAGLFKHPGDEEFGGFKGGSADRAGPGPVPFKTIGTPGDMHKPVYLSHGRKSGRLYPFSPFKPGGTNRAGPGRAGNPLPQGAPFSFPVPDIMGISLAHGKKKAVSKPEEQYSDENKYQALNKGTHACPMITGPWRRGPCRLY
jgi:hypothetical protein